MDIYTQSFFFEETMMICMGKSRERERESARGAAYSALRAPAMKRGPANTDGRANAAATQTSGGALHL